MARVVPALALLGTTAAALTGLLFWKSRTWVVPRRVRIPMPEDGGVEEVRFPSRDGTQLYGRLRVAEATAPAIALCHGYGTSIEETSPFATKLWKEGFSTLVFDFRAHGRSTGRFTTIGAREVDDALGAVDYLHERLPGAPLGIYGVSMGGSVALQTAALDERIGAVAADCAYATLAEMVEFRKQSFRGLSRPFFHLSRWAAERMSGVRVRQFRPVDHVERIAPRPVLLMHSELDEIVPLEHFYQIGGRLPPESERWLIEGCGHVAASSERAEEYLERVAGFFRRALAADPVPRTNGRRISASAG
jgi:alpha-beta hydrolase superfamily lysophospholipase